jgi:hypothetical protein
MKIPRGKHNKSTGSIKLRVLNTDPLFYSKKQSNIKGLPDPRSAAEYPLIFEKAL